jgi:uncharacterized alpha-E superfamily protein
MRSDAHQFVAQEQVALSTAPVWTENGLLPRHLVMRVFAVPHGGGYKVMPGGLTRISASLDTLVVSVQRGGGSKDTWVLGRVQEPEFSLLRPVGRALEVNRATFDLPSRVADNLFWLGRYMERVDSGVRLARTALPFLSQELTAASTGGLKAVTSILAAAGYIRPDRQDPQPNGKGGLDRELVSMIFDSERRYSLGSIVHEVRGLAWLLRDRISIDAWRILNRLDHDFTTRRPPEPLQILEASELLDQAILTLAAFSGLVMESMTRGQGWRFLDIGRRLERASQMSEMLLHGLGTQADDDAPRLNALLEIADSSITYRSRYLTTLQADLALDLLLCDDANPRSVVFQLERLSEHIGQLPESQASPRLRPESRVILSLLTSVQLAEISDLVRTTADGEWVNLPAFLRRLTHELKNLSDVLSVSYFSHAIRTQLLRFL